MFGSDPVGLPSPETELGGMNLAGEPPGVAVDMPDTPPRLRLLNWPSSYKLINTQLLSLPNRIYQFCMIGEW